jgi:hypothetical protein
MVDLKVAREEKAARRKTKDRLSRWRKHGGTNWRARVRVHS